MRAAKFTASSFKQRRERIAWLHARGEVLDQRSDGDTLHVAVIHDETGLLVEPADAKALAGAIARLLKDADLRKQFGEAGRARVTEHFGVDRLVEGTLDVYRKVAAR